MWAHKQCLADEFLSFYRTLCFWGFVFVNETFSAGPLFIFLSQLTELRAAHYCTVSWFYRLGWVEISFAEDAKWQDFFSYCRELFIPLVSCPCCQLPSSLLCLHTSFAVPVLWLETNTVHVKLDRTVQHCLSLLLAWVWHLRLRGDLEFLCCFSSFSRKCIIFRSSQEKTRDFLILLSFELEKKMQDSSWKGTHVHSDRLEGKVGGTSRVIFCF